MSMSSQKRDLATDEGFSRNQMSCRSFDNGGWQLTSAPLTRGEFARLAIQVLKLKKGQAAKPERKELKEGAKLVLEMQES